MSGPPQGARRLEGILRLFEQPRERRDRSWIAAPAEDVDGGKGPEEASALHRGDQLIDRGPPTDPAQPFEGRHGYVVVRVLRKADKRGDGAGATPPPEDLGDVRDDGRVAIIRERLDRG